MAAPAFTPPPAARSAASPRAHGMMIHPPPPIRPAALVATMWSPLASGSAIAIESAGAVVPIAPGAGLTWHMPAVLWMLPLAVLAVVLRQRGRWLLARLRAWRWGRRIAPDQAAAPKTGSPLPFPPAALIIAIEAETSRAVASSPASAALRGGRAGGADFDRTQPDRQDALPIEDRLSAARPAPTSPRVVAWAVLGHVRRFAADHLPPLMVTLLVTAFAQPVWHGPAPTPITTDDSIAAAPRLTDTSPGDDSRLAGAATTTPSPVIDERLYVLDTSSSMGRAVAEGASTTALAAAVRYLREDLLTLLAARRAASPASATPGSEASSTDREGPHTSGLAGASARSTTARSTTAAAPSLLNIGVVDGDGLRLLLPRATPDPLDLVRALDQASWHAGGYANLELAVEEALQLPMATMTAEAGAIADVHRNGPRHREILVLTDGHAIAWPSAAPRDEPRVSHATAPTQLEQTPEMSAAASDLTSPPRAETNASAIHPAADSFALRMLLFRSMDGVPQIVEAKDADSIANDVPGIGTTDGAGGAGARSESVADADAATRSAQPLDATSSAIPTLNMRRPPLGRDSGVNVSTADVRVRRVLAGSHAAAAVPPIADAAVRDRREVRGAEEETGDEANEDDPRAEFDHYEVTLRNAGDRPARGDLRWRIVDLDPGRTLPRAWRVQGFELDGGGGGGGKDEITIDFRAPAPTEGFQVAVLTLDRVSSWDQFEDDNIAMVFRPPASSARPLRVGLLGIDISGSASDATDPGAANASGDAPAAAEEVRLLLQALELLQAHDLVRIVNLDDDSRAETIPGSYASRGNATNSGGPAIDVLMTLASGDRQRAAVDRVLGRGGTVVTWLMAPGAAPPRDGTSSADADEVMSDSSSARWHIPEESPLLSVLSTGAAVALSAATARSESAPPDRDVPPVAAGRGETEGEPVTVTIPTTMDETVTLLAVRTEDGDRPVFTLQGRSSGTTDQGIAMAPTTLVELEPGAAAHAGSLLRHPGFPVLLDALIRTAHWSHVERTAGWRGEIIAGRERLVTGRRVDLELSVMPDTNRARVQQIVWYFNNTRVANLSSVDAAPNAHFGHRRPAYRPHDPGLMLVRGTLPDHDLSPVVDRPPVELWAAIPVIADPRERRPHMLDASGASQALANLTHRVMSTQDEDETGSAVAGALGAGTADDTMSSDERVGRTWPLAGSLLALALVLGLVHLMARPQARHAGGRTTGRPRAGAIA